MAHPTEVSIRFLRIGRPIESIGFEIAHFTRFGGAVSRRGIVNPHGEQADFLLREQTHEESACKRQRRLNNICEHMHDIINKIHISHPTNGQRPAQHNVPMMTTRWHAACWWWRCDDDGDAGAWWPLKNRTRHALVIFDLGALSAGRRRRVSLIARQAGLIYADICYYTCCHGCCAKQGSRAFRRARKRVSPSSSVPGAPVRWIFNSNQTYTVHRCSPPVRRLFHTHRTQTAEREKEKTRSGALVTTGRTVWCCFIITLGCRPATASGPIPGRDARDARLF